jgi:hypothetical protein
MKIEGLGQAENRWLLRDPNMSGRYEYGRRLKPEQLKVGLQIGESHYHNNDWIITDVLGDGKFKAVPKDAIGGMEEQLRQFGSSPYDAINALAKGNKKAKEIIGGAIENETFDISGKIDTENPIYKFYEKEVGRYLQNKYGAKIITDPQGVKWWEVRITPEMKKEPVGAFSMKKPQISSIA